MAATTDDLIRVIEEQTAATKRQSNILGQMEAALTDAVGVNESLKGAMLKSGRFTEEKMFGITQSLSRSIGDFDKGMRANIRMLAEGLEVKGLEGAFEQITALGLNFQPFQNLVRHMDRELGFGTDQRNEQIKLLLALRDVTKANPELLAQELNKISGFTRGVAGLFGPDFAQSFQAAVSVLAGDSPQLISQLTTAFSKAFGPGADGVRIRTMLGMPRDLTGMSPQQTLSMLMDIIQKSQGGMFGDFMTKSVLGKLVGFSPRDFAALGTAAGNMRGRNPMAEMAEAMRRIEQGFKMEEIMKKWNSMINSILNPMHAVFNTFMERVLKWSTPLMNTLAEWSQTAAESTAKWIDGAIKAVQESPLAKMLWSSTQILFSEIKGGLVDMFSGDGANAGGGILTMLGGIFKWIVSAVPRFFSNTVTFFKNFFPMMSLVLQDAGALIFNALKSTLATVVGAFNPLAGAGISMKRDMKRVDWQKETEGMGFKGATEAEAKAATQISEGWTELKASFDKGFNEERIQRMGDTMDNVLLQLKEVTAMMASFTLEEA